MKLLSLIGLSFILLLIFSNTSYAHCDGEDGPVVTSARKALDEKNVNLVLIWVQKKDEVEIRDAYNKALSVRYLNPAAKELADKYFFETVVRIHRMGEGAPFTGVKPAGFNNDISVLTADKTLETNSPEELYALLTRKIESGLHEKFEEVKALQNYDKNDVDAGRRFISAYVNFLHYAEGIYKTAAVTEISHEHAEKHAE